MIELLRILPHRPLAVAGDILQDRFHRLSDLGLLLGRGLCRLTPLQVTNHDASPRLTDW